MKKLCSPPLALFCSLKSSVAVFFLFHLMYIQVSDGVFQSIVTAEETPKLWLQFTPHLPHLKRKGKQQCILLHRIYCSIVSSFKKKKRSIQVLEPQKLKTSDQKEVHNHYCFAWFLIPDEKVRSVQLYHPSVSVANLKLI